MGFTYVKVRVYNPADIQSFSEVELMVDSGAIFTSIPTSQLEELGLKPLERRKLSIYGGGTVERGIGGAVIEYENHKAFATVIFGEERDAKILGATTLESLGYQLDPVTKKLKPVELLMLKT